MSKLILTINPGSFNTKLTAFDVKTRCRKDYAETHNAKETSVHINSIGTLNIAAIGYRVVHGGQDFVQPVLLTDDIVTSLARYIPMAPLHQPVTINLIADMRKRYPQIPHVACFDTGFHHTIADIQRRLPLPRAFHDEGIMRYGFHGLSYQHIAAVAPQIIGDAAQGRVVVVHLGGGASACAMKNLRSVGCTTGFSTLDGLMMGTRCGALDPGLILYLLAEKQMSVPEVSDLLNFQSGLRGVSGISNNMQGLLDSTSAAAQEAIELYCISAAKQIAGMLPLLGGLDALIFTGGIGENAAPVRDRITELLRWAGEFPTYVIPTDEEIVIADACQQFLT